MADTGLLSMALSGAVVLAAFIAHKSKDESYELSSLESFLTSTYATFTLILLSSSMAVSHYFKRVRGFDENRHKTYDNGVSVMFALRILAGGPGFQTLMKVTAASTRRRLYSGMRKYVFFGREIWTAGHPALCKHIFQPSNAKLWHKVDKPTLNAIFFQPDVPNNAMLYTGDDDRWKHARMTWSNFFLETNFSIYDEKIDDIVSKHLVRLLKYRKGRAELLELMLYVTIDLLCQVLYGATLPQGELNILVEALAEFTVPATSHRGRYPGGLDCKAYHSKIAKEISDKAPDGVFVKIIMNDELMSEELRYENCAFFLEALTPAFASFWTLSNIILKNSVEKGCKQRCLEDPIYREQCIKESLRMYPPVPALWGRIANKTHTFENPIYDATVKDERSFLGKIFSDPDIRTLENITIHEGTMVMVIPACLHYDDRVWMNADEFLPSRWDKDPRIIQDNFTTARKARQSVWGALALGKGEDAMARLEEEKKVFKSKKGGYDANSMPIRYKLFGPDYEESVERENHEQLKVASDIEDLMTYSFFPFGLGKHMCLGRRLAIKMVDGIVANLLSYDINFENGVTPNLFKRHWTDRLNTVSAAYNYSADPVYVEFGDTKGDIRRIESMFTQEAKVARKTMMMKMETISEIHSGVADFAEKSAILFITCQNEFLDPKGKLYSKVEDVMKQLGTKEHLKELMDAAIMNDALVIHAPVEIAPGVNYSTGGFDEWNLASQAGVFAPNTWNSELHEDTSAGPGDVILTGRKGPDCVTGTILVKTLENHQIDRLFVCGLLTDVTVENTVTALAKKMGKSIKIHPVSDATASFTLEAHNTTFNVVLGKCSEPVTTEHAVEMLQQVVEDEGSS